MRIAALVHNRVHYGTFQRAHALARHLVRRGHEVTLYAGAVERAAPARETVLDGVVVVEACDSLPQRFREGGLSPFDLAHRLRHLRGLRPELIHCFDHRPTVSVPGLSAARRLKIPCLVDWADLWGRDGIASERGPVLRAALGSLDTFFENAVRRRADALTVISTALRDRAQERFSVPIHLLPVGSNSDLMKPIPKAEARRALRLPLDAPIAVYAGLAPYDAEYLARSFVLLAQMQPRALLVTAGRRFEALERASDAAGISDRLIQLGNLERNVLVHALSSADVLLLPYTNRSVNRFRYPNKLGDYLAVGRPIVTNPTADLGKLVRKERVALLTDDTPEAFAAATSQLFDDPALADEIGERGRALAESKLDWGFLAAGLERFYIETLARFRR